MAADRMSTVAEILRGARRRDHLGAALSIADTAISLLERHVTPAHAELVARLRRQYQSIHGASRQEDRTP